jgi:GDP-4-dehydro-6-deoxy-D-mannose reductase
MMRRGPVVVTGAGGFIGRRLITALQTAGYMVHGWRRSDVELGDAAAVSRAMAAIAPTTVFHLASSGVLPHRQTEDCIALDEAMTANVVAAMPAGSVLVQAGSMAEYGHAGRLVETASTVPTSLYGRAKLASTQRAIRQGAARGLAVRVARIFGAYGPGEPAGRLIPALTDKLSRGEAVALSDGAQRRDFIHVDDACRLLIRLAAIDAGEPIIVNIGTGVAVSIRFACERIAQALGADPGLLHFNVIQRRATDEALLEADTSRLIALLGAAPPQRLLDDDDDHLRALLMHGIMD